MRIVELRDGLPHIPSALAVRKVGLELKLSLAVGGPPNDATILTNFKPWLTKPDEEHWVSVPGDGGKLVLVSVTGRKCCEAFLQGICELIKVQNRRISKDTVIRFSEPPFTGREERKEFQTTVTKVAREVGFRDATFSFFRESDAVFEYFRLLRRQIPPQAQGKSLNVLVLDFGGGTCNVSVVSTTREGERWERYVAAPVASEAPQAGGLYIDNQLLVQALQGADMKRLYMDPGQRRAFESWLVRHAREAEVLKRKVSETDQPWQLTVRLDGELAQAVKGERDLHVELSPAALREIVSKHWSKRGILKSVQEVLKQLREKLVSTARRKNVAEDARELITHIVVAGGSSRLPGFIEECEAFFKPYRPPIFRVDRDFPFSVAVGMGLNHLALEKRLLDDRPDVPMDADTPKALDPSQIARKATDSTFLPNPTADLCVFWGKPSENLPPSVVLEAHRSYWDLAHQPTLTRVSLPARAVAGPGFRRPSEKRRLEYQVAYRNDEEVESGLSAQRFNVSDRFIPVPESKVFDLRACLDDQRGQHPELKLDVLEPMTEEPVTTQRIALLLKESASGLEVPAASMPKPSEKAKKGDVQTGKLRGGGVDVLCIDFGTTNTTVFDLLPESEISLEAFMSKAPTVLQATEAQVTPLAAPPPPATVKAAQEVQATLPAPTAQDSKDARARPTSLPAPGAAAGDRPPSRIERPPPRPGTAFVGAELDYVKSITSLSVRANSPFTQDLVETVYLSMKVRPLVVLAGPPGVGKSALARIFAEASGASFERRDALRVAVEAHWTDSRFLFGRQGKHGFIETDFFRFLKRAAQYPDRPYYVLMDEMNLAHVEYYFAQFLSAMESDGVLTIPDVSEDERRIRLPIVDGAGTSTSLVRFFGTINVDESTQILSDKVLDRANLIELEPSAPGEQIPVSARGSDLELSSHLPLERLREWQRLDAKELKVPEEIRRIWSVLANPKAPPDLKTEPPPRPVSIGHRIIRDITVFVHYAERLGGVVDRKKAIDLQIKQRILPKIRGDVRLDLTLKGLATCLEEYGLEGSLGRLCRMQDQLQHDQFVTFWS